MSEGAGEVAAVGTLRAEGSSAPRRKHRPGLQRVQIACERCRTRKNKCDRKLPECSTCKAAGAVCIVMDRLTNRQYPRGHVEGLEADVQQLRARVQELELETTVLREELGRAHGRLPLDTAHGRGTPAALGNTDEADLLSQQSTSPFVDISEDINAVPHDVTSSRRFVGDSSGLFFGNIVKGVLLQADYKGEQGPSKSALRLRVGDRQAMSPAAPSVANPGPSNFDFPEPDLADKLQNAYFTCRWPALPFMHRPSFVEKHFAKTMALGPQADDTSNFLTFMVFALGAIDVKRQVPSFAAKHIEYFKHATQNHLQGLLKEDSIETVQGLLLIAQFAVNEHQSTNAWQVAGQAVRTAVDLGLHRNCNHSPGSRRSMFDLEMRKRVFWSTYALDRNISITLGRPCALRDEDIDMSFPQNIKDNDLVGDYMEIGFSDFAPPQPLDMTTFLHIIRLRQLQSRIQSLFYSPDTSQVQAHGIGFHQNLLRSQLDDWIAKSPRYSHPTMPTFQSIEWFQIAYSHALLLLYRPSPANPVIDSSALQICADSAISLISSYSSLYAKNKITYTWIALHGLFMASITMLYTLYVSPEIRASTTKAVVKSNIMSCLALFEVMAEYWPLAERCHDVIERLGGATLGLFDVPVEASTPASESSRKRPSQDQHFGQINAEFMEWFGNRHAHSQPNPNESENADSGPIANMHYSDPDMILPEGTDLFPEIMDQFFPQEFDTTLPMMMNAFGTGAPTSTQMPRLSDASDGTAPAPPNM